MILNITYIKKLVINKKLYNFYYSLKMPCKISLQQLFCSFIYVYDIGRYT